MICEICGEKQEKEEQAECHEYFVIENDYAELTITDLNIVNKQLIKKKTLVGTDVYISARNNIAYSKSCVFETYQDAVDWLRAKTTKLQMRSGIVTGWKAIMEGEKE